eukprot:TRINITY_DN97275_c0_g1_i1.p1 TRINITY_DN97275_c0_g1~~TRINITY_DN97275_c0_g1_i1.p1  ORF type:complete len:301 (+),score=49.79 TRINITY_DN97275_c0_g1_i1:79-981(+)
MIVGTRHLNGREQLEQELRLRELAGSRDLDERGKAEIRRRRAESADQREREFREREGRRLGADELAARLAARRAAADAAAEQPPSSARMPPSMPGGCRSPTAELAGRFASLLPAEARAPLSRSTSVNSARRPGRCAGQDCGSVGDELAAKLAARRAAADAADGLERPAMEPCTHASNACDIKHEHAGFKSTADELFTKLAARRLRVDAADQSSRAASVPPPGPAKHDNAEQRLTGICRAPGNQFTGELAACQLAAEASSDNSRTPSPPAIAQPPRAPPPSKRRPCGVTRSHSWMRRMDGQ